MSEIIEDRPLGPALAKGWRMRCPNCGAGKLFNGYLKVRDQCEFCNERLSEHRADDAPSWLTMIIVGHLLAPLLLTAFQVTDLPVWAHAIIWPTIAMAMILLLLPRIKGGVIAFQWAKRMHGFDRRP
ncbi:MAG: DUF983 domain-containing protein [Pseudomonadota bacterium]